jgi:hypothetical protein
LFYSFAWYFIDLRWSFSTCTHIFYNIFMDRINETINHDIVYSTCNLWYAKRQCYSYFCKWQDETFKGLSMADWTLNLRLGSDHWKISWDMDRRHKGNNKITEHRAIFQRERQNSLVNKQKKSFHNRKTRKTALALTWYRHFQRNGGLNQILQTT